MNEQYGFIFSQRNNDVIDGAVSADEEIFRDSDHGEALTRELTQNSLDAKAPGFNGPVKIKVELKQVPINQIPDVETLKLHLGQSVKAVAGSNDVSNRLGEALEVLNGDTISVLRIGDYNTTGLRGEEDDRDGKPPLLALTRGNGVSQKGGGTGGSFGIGAKSASGASSIRTVFWTTLADDKKIPVIAGRAILAGHKLDENPDIMLAPDGFYRQLNTEKFTYERSSEGIFGFSPRTENGTDTYVLGYRGLNEDGKLREIQRAFAHNFMVAIHEGDLVVEGIVGSTRWELNQDSLGSFLSEDNHEDSPAMQAYYAAIQEAPEIISVPRLGKVEVYLNLDEDLSCPYKPMYMRSPRMQVFIDTRMHKVSENFAAVVICRSEEGNRLLRSWEPPAHDKWAPKERTDQETLSKLKNQVRAVIVGKIKKTVGDEITLRGLERFLPSSLSTGLARRPSSNPIKQSNKLGMDKGKEVIENERLIGKKLNEELKRKAITESDQKITVSATSGTGSKEITKGKDRGGQGTRSGSGTPFTGNGERGEGNSRIAADSIRMRLMFTEPGIGRMVLVPTASNRVSGEIELVAISDGNSPEEYDLGFKKVWIAQDDGEQELRFDGNVIKDLQIEPEGLEVWLEFSLKRRFALAVK